MNIGIPNPLDGVKKVAGAAQGAAQEAVEAGEAAAGRTAQPSKDDAHGLAGVVDGAWDQAAEFGEEALGAIVPEGLIHKIPGLQGDVESKADKTRTFGSEDEAKAAQARASAALLDVNHWGETLANVPPQRFELYDAAGHHVDRPAQPGDYVKITPLVPGTDKGVPASNWVRVETAGVTADKTEIVVRPSKDPTGADKSPIAHTFDSRATNTFSVERSGATLTSRVHGEHEYANTGRESGGAPQAVRNKAAAELLWGSPVRHVHVPGLDVPVTPSSQQVLWDNFTNNLVNR